MTHVYLIEKDTFLILLLLYVCYYVYLSYSSLFFFTDADYADTNCRILFVLTCTEVSYQEVK